VPEVVQDEQRRLAGQLVVDRQARDEQVDDGGAQIQAGDGDDGEFRGDEPAVQAEADQNAFSASCGLMSAPPMMAPSTMAATVVPSIQLLATTSFSGGSSSVRMPYLAGEYMAAPTPTMA
jgi:hypothetical protein